MDEQVRDGSHHWRNIKNNEVSLGDTDKFWWEKTGLRIANSNARLFIFSKTEDLPRRREYMVSNKKDEFKNLFVSHLGFEKSVKEKIKKKTFVCLNSNMFKVKQQRIRK